jgi:DNA-binding MarR family transcriptional regulator
VVAGSREDRREKAIQLTRRGREQLRVMANHLASLGLTVECSRDSGNDSSDEGLILEVHAAID